MDSFNFPKYGEQQMTGNRGETFFEHFVTNSLGFIYRKVHRENDFGIDGYVDVVDKRQVTGRSIAVQIKCGDSYLSKMSDGGIRYSGENKHLNFLMNLNCPVILVVMDSSCLIGYWSIFSPNTTNPSQNGWWTEIPKTNLLRADIKAEWMRIAGFAEDFTERLKISWQANTAIDESLVNFYAVHRDDIEKYDFTGLHDFIERMFRTKELSIKNRGKINLIIAGYDDDPRELYEIPEVRTWFQTSIDKSIPWFYILDSTLNNTTLKIFLYSCCEITISNQSINTKQIAINDFNYINQWVDINFHNLNLFIDERNISEHINEEISKNIAEFLRSLPHN